MKICCQNCQKSSGIEKTDRIGADAAQVQNNGFLVKNFFLYGIDQWVFACSTECLKKITSELFAKHNVSDETKAEVKQLIDESKRKIPQMAAETCRAMDRFQQLLNKVISKRSTNSVKVKVL